MNSYFCTKLRQDCLEQCVLCFRQVRHQFINFQSNQLVPLFRITHAGLIVCFQPMDPSCPPWGSLGNACENKNHILPATQYTTNTCSITFVLIHVWLGSGQTKKDNMVQWLLRLFKWIDNHSQATVRIMKQHSTINWNGHAKCNPTWSTHATIP